MKKKNDSYVWALDLSLNSPGITIFQNDAKPVFIGSIDTSKCKDQTAKLRMFGNKIVELMELYKPFEICFEKGFYRFAGSSEAIFRVFGVAQYLLSDYPQYFYAPTTIKKVVGGHGGIKKDELAKVILEKYCDGNVSFRNDDESDSYAVGCCYFIKNGVLK
jgi:crossover junction endodeoxyribonuclease RuvC